MNIVRFPLTIFVINFFVSSCTPAFAQFVTDETPPTAQPRPQQQLDPRVRERIGSVRVITGSYRVEGWENSLIQGDPTLRHWHWSPMTNFIQSTPSMPTGKQATHAPTIVEPPHYVKPRHVDTIVFVKEPARSSYIHQSQQRYASSSSNSTNTSSGQVFGRIRPISNQPLIASYGSYQNSSSGTASGALTNQEVHGMLVHR